ncbi:MAG: T9SS type A sorting domain-containing protein [Bacteroidia bacterium]|nr:T9SS type A sorting domain-containing protein [Bacteroidia bacterium]
MRHAIPFLLGGCFLWAQIQLQSSDLPQASTQYTVSQSLPRPGIDFTLTGADYEWRFGQLSSDTQLTVDWKAPWQVLQYSFSCGNASFQALLLKIADSIQGGGGITIRDLYAFFRKSSSQMSTQGVGAMVNGVPITQCYQDPDELYVLPLSYENRDSTTFWLRFTFQAPFGNITLAQRGYRLHHVDGYGYVETPYGRHACLRLRRDVHQWDTLYFNGAPFQRRDTTYTELEWLGQGQGIPLLRVQGVWNTVGGNLTFVPNTIQYKDVPRVSSLSFGGDRVLVSPNPTQGILYISVPGGRYAIYNLIGLLVQEGEIPSHGQVRLTPEIPDGVYFLKVVQQGKESWHRFILAGSQ